MQAVAENGSFAEAGRQLAMPRAVASQLIAQLEAQLGTKLFKRTTRKVALTEAGDALIARITRPLSEIRESLSSTRVKNSQLAGTVSCSVSHALGRALVLPNIAVFAAKHPEVQVELLLADRLDDLIVQNIDFSIRMGELQNSSMVARKLGMLSVVLVASNQLLKTHGTPRNLAQLANLPSVGFRMPGQGTLYSWQLRENKKSTDDLHTVVPSRAAVVCNSIEGVFDLARAGVGVAAIPRYLVEADIVAGRLKPVLERYRLPDIPVYLYFISRAMMPKRVRLLADHLAQASRSWR